jgi:hypothetical protein
MKASHTDPAYTRARPKPAVARRRQRPLPLIA